MTAVLRVRVRVPGARSHPVAALIFAFAFLFVSVVPIYMVQLAPDFFIFAIVLLGFFFWCYKEVVGPTADRRGYVVADALAAGAALRRRRGGAARRRDVCQADATSALIMPLLVSAAAAQAVVRGRPRSAVVFGGVVIGAVRAEHRPHRRLELPGR